MFNKKEIRDLIISILVLSFVFGFNDGRKEFVGSLWLSNFLKITLFVIISVLFREAVIKLYAKRNNAESEYKIWNVKRVFFGKYGNLKFPFPFGIIFSFIGIIVSQGKFFFTAIGIHDIKENKSARTGRKYIFIKDFEVALIALSGIFANLLIVYIAFFASKYFGINLNFLINMNLLLILFNLIPISALDGTKIFFGSRLLWVFTCLFLISSYIFLSIGILFSIIGAAILAFSIMAWYYYQYEYS
ncbi:hypothetical protein J4440_02330 [Candidatus Woesearchaeota archaeon]|nr:hypothetical protein [Candidatus Woesearchaeota archaeon]